MDDVDIANDLADLVVQTKIKEASNKVVPTNKSGKCWYCGEALSDTRRWCSSECRDQDVKHN
jgi:hypothetical protein